MPGQGLLRAIHAGVADVIAELREHHPESIDPPWAKLAGAQLVLARRRALLEDVCSFVRPAFVMRDTNSQLLAPGGESLAA